MASDFSNQKLQGRSFKGQALSNADFRGADVRGVDFSNAVLLGANLAHIKTGLNPSWSLCLRIGLVVLAALSSFVAAYAGTFFGSLLPRIKSPLGLVFVSIFTLSLFTLFIFITIRRGLGIALSAFAIVSIIALAILAAFPGVDDTRGVAIVLSMAIAIHIAGVVAGAIAGAVAQILPGQWVWVIMGLVALAAALMGVKSGTEELTQYGEFVAVMAGAVPILIVSIGLSLYVSYQAIRGNPKYALICKIAISTCNYGGTSFRGANLTYADFTQANLKHADFRDAILTRTRWFQANHLAQAQTSGTCLEDPKIRQLVVTLNGQDQNFDQMDLRGLNLQGANLADASLIGAKLSEAILQDVDLARAKLVQTQLYGANLTGACLTGACIQDWAISTDTHLEQVRCEHVYMRLPTQEDPDPWRKPDNRHETFREGDFTDFIAPIIKTLDLYRQQNVDPRQIASTFKSLDFYHYGGIDPAAAAIALKQLAEEYPEAGLEVVVLEGRGEEKIRLQAVVMGEADSSQLNAKYFEKYRQISSLPYRDIQALLAGASEKDERIRSLERLLENALQQPKFYVETYQNQGEFSMSQSRGNVNINSVQGNISGIAAAGENQTMTGVAIGAISGFVTNTISQLPASPDSASLGIKELLTQLQVEIEAESELPDEDKAEALEQVKTLAEAGQKPEDNILQKAAKTSMKILKGTVASLTDAAKLTEACSKLLPLITKALGLPF